MIQTVTQTDRHGQEHGHEYRQTKPVIQTKTGACASSQPETMIQTEIERDKDIHMKTDRQSQ